MFAQESEPNDTPATADTAKRGNSYQATISPFDQATSNRDLDYWVISANAGETIFVDIDADEFGSKMDMGLTLYAGDGTTWLASNDGWDGMDPHLEYAVQTTGIYYVLAGTSLETTPWGTAKPYTIHFFQVKCPTTGDSEPNDTTATATSATVGQTVHGMSCPGTDVDFFKFDLNPGTYEFNFEMDPHERPAFGSAIEIAGWIVLYGPDGKTELGRTQGEETPDRIEYTVRTRGTYYLRADIYPGGIRYTYSIKSRLMSGPVPGDPITVRADLGSNGYADGVAVEKNGDILLSDLNAKIWRVSPQGAKTRVAAQVEIPAGLAWDSDGNLLIVNATNLYANTSTEGGVFKLSPSGQLSRFVTDDRASGSIAIARDGSIWLTAYQEHALLHYSAQGNLIATHDVPATAAGDGPLHVALGPSGDPFVVTYQDLYRLRDGHAERVVHYDQRTDGSIGAFAFDMQGNIYIPNARAGVINVHAIAGNWLATIAYEPSEPARVFFGRNSDGSTNARLFAIDAGKLIELAAGGARAPGLPVQFDRQDPPPPPPPPPPPGDSIAVAKAVDALLHPGNGALTSAQLTQLDQLGNKNGRYDVGDLRALLVRAGAVTGTALIPR